MKGFFPLIVLSMLFADQPALAQAERIQLAQNTIQVISCGMKDGKWKEYPMPAAAAADGATNVRPKGDKPCGGAEK